MEAGCRFFDIRCRAQGDRFAIHHGELYQHLAFGDVLEYCKGFLSENPTETLFMRVKQEYSSVSNEEFKRIFYGYDTSHFYLESRVPTLSEVRGKIILLANVAGLGESTTEAPTCLFRTTTSRRAGKQSWMKSGARYTSR